MLRFYQRIALIFVVFYTTALNAPFLRGMIAWLVCMSILVMDFAYVPDFDEMQRRFSLIFSRYKPYVNPDMQRLSSVCCILLVTMSSVLLRSQSLLSSARSINFDPSNPIEAAENQSVDVNFTIVILVGCIFVPFVVVLKLHHILQTCFTVIKNRWMQRKQRVYIHGRIVKGAEALSAMSQIRSQASSSSSAAKCAVTLTAPTVTQETKLPADPEKLRALIAGV